ncbi:MAG: FAD-binding oxidoreductase [Thermodesulfobacteriota bacterium]
MSDSIKEIHNIVGSSNIFDESQQLESYSVEGKEPRVVVFPSTKEEISEILKLANRDSLSVIPWGSGTKIGIGNKPNKADIVLSTDRLNRVIEHNDSDLVATTECGVKLSKFQTALKEKNQSLPIDPPHVELGASIGGIIATNDSGPRRLRYGTAHGTMRELVLGIKIIRPDGEIAKAGAKVVKSVAGYDIPKLLVGSLGTLGIIIEATLRLYTIPEHSLTYLASFSSIQEAHATALSILNSSLTPTCLELVNSSLSESLSAKLELNLKKNAYILAIRFESVEKAVNNQAAKLKEICSNDKGQGLIVEGDIEAKFWYQITEFPWIKDKSKTVVCKTCVLIKDVSILLEKLEDLSKNSGLEILASARAGNGVLITSLDGDTPNLLQATRSLRAQVSSLNGNMVIQQAPPSIKSEIDVWGEIGSSLELMRRLKSQFDPNGVMNPGRFVGGI